MADIVTVLAVSLLVLLAARYLLSRRWLWRCPGPNMPGPSGPPFVGSTFQIDLNVPHVTFSEWALKYGPIYKVNLMGQYVVFCNDYKTISKALTKSGSSFLARPDSFCVRSVSEGRRGLGFGVPDRAWSAVRKVVHRTLKAQSGGSKTIEDAMEDLDTNLMEHFKKHEGKPFLPWSDVNNYALQSLYRFAFGESVEYDDERFKMIEEYERTGQAVMGGPAGRQLDTFPWLRWLGHSAYRSLQRMNDIANALWQSHNAGFEETDNNSVMNELVKAQKLLLDDEGKPIIDTISVKRTFVGLFIAGISTVATAMYVIIHVLAYYPEIQKKILQEIHSQFGERRPSLAQKDLLPYTRAFLMEILRNSSTTPMALPHATQKDVAFEGYTIPEGTTVFMNLWHLHHDDTFWQDPFVFKPERYLDDDGRLVAADHPSMRHTMPFGAGQRSCVGEVFALPRLFLFICNLVQQFEVRAVDGEECPCDPRTFQLGLVLHPKDCQTRLVPRH